MRIQYKKTEKGFEYTVDEPYATFTFTLENEVKNVEALDDIFMAIYQVKDRAETVKGEVKITGERNLKIIGQEKVPYKVVNKENSWDNIFDEEARAFIEKVTGIDYYDIKRKELDNLSAHYADCGYKLNDQFKQILLDFKKNYE